MKLSVKLLLLTSVFALSAGIARAAITAQEVVRTYQDAAYTRIEVKEGPTQIKVEAIKDGVKIEVIYDKDSGAVISKEQHSVGASEAAATGVEISQDDTDFEDGHNSGSDDDGSDDHDGSGSGSDDDGSDDHDGSGSGSDDDGSDDHGGSGSGSDDDGSDDDGGSGSGSDDGADHDSGDDHGSDD